MPSFISPSGNSEVWEERPNGYFTQEEWDEQHPDITPELSTEELAQLLRTERDERITSCDWIMARHAEQVALGVDTTLTAESYAAWLAYRQELRDMPSADGFPWDGGGEETPWPSEPDNL